MTLSPVRALIVDDEPAARAALRSLLDEDPEVEIVGEAADGRSAISAIERKTPDLVFLDVQMPEMDGFTALRQLSPSRRPVVVFVTAYDQYALQAFDVHAVDYLLKPFGDERFRQALAHAKARVRQGDVTALGRQLQALLDMVGKGGPRSEYLERLTVRASGRVMIIRVRDVDWFEAKGDYVRVHAGRSEHLLRETMKALEQQLDPARFVRIHRSSIVHLDRIKELQPFFRGEYVVILQDGTRLKLARGYKAKLEGVLGRPF